MPGGLGQDGGPSAGEKGERQSRVETRQAVTGRIGRGRARWEGGGWGG